MVKHEKWFLVALFFVSFLIRAGVYYWYLGNDNRYWQVDSNTYHVVAKSFAEGKGIALSGGIPNFYRLPGYPIFIASFYKLCGADPYKALWGQIVLASCIPLLIFFLALAMFPRRRWLAYAAGAGGAVHIGLVLYAGFFMTESLFLVLFLLFLIFFFRAIHYYFCSYKPDVICTQACGSDCVAAFIPDPMPMVPTFMQFYERVVQHSKNVCRSRTVCASNRVLQSLLMSGFFLGLASLVRPVGQYLIWVVLALIAVSVGTWQQKLRNGVVFFCAWLFPVLFWLIRNYLLLGHLFFHTLPGGHFLYLSATRVMMEANQVPYQRARFMATCDVRMLMREKARQLGRPLNEIERCYVHEQLARHYFAQHPLITAKIWLTDMIRTCLSLYSAEVVYLESGRKSIDYFSADRTWWSLFERYLFPQTDSTLVRALVYTEIGMFLLLLLGFLFGLLRFLCYRVPKLYAAADLCSWLRAIPFMGLFIVIALAGGYARMRLPIEPLLVILSLYGWGLGNVFIADKNA
jgi:4-amino-4-deoxy-L-arabinose transferase-like glycosyltransferase